MSLQTTVRRAYATGIAGQIVRDGPRRAKPARIVSATLGTDPAASTNRFSRVFGYAGELPAMGTTLAALEAEVVVGGADFFGLLINPQHNALYGNNGDALGANLDLPIYSEGEFTDMVSGLIVELFNETTAIKAVTYGDQIAYALTTVTAEENAQVIPLGGLITVAAGAEVPAGFALVPNGKIINAQSLAASSAGAPSVALAMIQI